MKLIPYPQIGDKISIKDNPKTTIDEGIMETMILLNCSTWQVELTGFEDEEPIIYNITYDLPTGQWIEKTE